MPEKAKASEENTRFSCITEAHQPTRQRKESVTKRTHEEHGKKEEQNLVHTFIPMPQAMKIPDAKALVDKEWKKLETIPTWDMRKVKSIKEVMKEAQNNNKVRFSRWWIYVISKIRSWSHNSRTTEEKSCFVETLWRTTPELQQYLLNKAHQHHEWRPQR